MNLNAGLAHSSIYSYPTHASSEIYSGIKYLNKEMKTKPSRSGQFFDETRDVGEMLRANTRLQIDRLRDKIIYNTSPF